jgi:hypothetical protein
MIPDLRTDNHLTIVETAVRREYMAISNTSETPDLVPVTVSLSRVLNNPPTKFYALPGSFL